MKEFATDLYEYVTKKYAGLDFHELIGMLEIVKAMVVLDLVLSGLKDDGEHGGERDAGTF